MRKTRCAAASVAVLPALLLASACSGNASNADGTGKTAKSTSSASSTPAGKAPLTKAQLTSALVTTTDVPGWTVQVSQTDATDSQDDSTLTADKPQCQPLADITSSKPKIPRLAFVGAAFAKTTGQATPDQIDQMLVASQAPGDAQKVIDSVKSALATCTSFSAVDNTGTKTPFAITKGPAVATGDASASYVMTDTADKKSGAALVSVVKTGNTITAYLSVKSAGGAGQLPLDVARKQNDKLKAAQAG